MLRAGEHEFGTHMPFARLCGLDPRTAGIPTAAQHGTHAEVEPVRLLDGVLEQLAPLGAHVVRSLGFHPRPAEAVDRHPAHALGLERLQVGSEARLVHLVA